MQALAIILSNLLLLGAAADKAKTPLPELDAILEQVSRSNRRSSRSGGST